MQFYNKNGLTEPSIVNDDDYFPSVNVNGNGLKKAKYGSQERVKWVTNKN